MFVRALEGLASAAQWDSVPDRSSLWAGLFDLRENLLNGAAQDSARSRGLSCAAQAATATISTPHVVGSLDELSKTTSA